MNMCSKLKACNLGRCVTQLRINENCPLLPLKCSAVGKLELKVFWCFSSQQLVHSLSHSVYNYFEHLLPLTNSLFKRHFFLPPIQHVLMTLAAGLRVTHFYHWEKKISLSHSQLMIQREAERRTPLHFSLSLCRHKKRENVKSVCLRVQYERSNTYRNAQSPFILKQIG